MLKPFMQIMFQMWDYEITATLTTAHARNGNTIVTIDNYTYDHVGRLLSQTQCVGDENMGDSCPASGDLEQDLAISGTINDLREANGSITVTSGAPSDRQRERGGTHCLQ